MSYSACLVNPVTVRPAAMDLPVSLSITPGRMAAPWQTAAKMPPLL